MKHQESGMYLTPKQAAEILSVHEETVLRWCKTTNPLHAQKIGGRWKIPSHVVRFAESVTVPRLTVVAA